MTQQETLAYWFAARTRYGQEIGVRDCLQKKGVEFFIPTHKVKNSHGHAVEKPLVSNLVFFKTNKKDALYMVNKEYLPVHYIIDCATHTLLTVSEKDMDNFRRVFDFSKDKGGLMDRPLELGDGVKVTKGPLEGVEGYVLEFLGETYVVVELMGCLWAKAKVPRAWLEETGREKPKIA